MHDCAAMGHIRVGMDRECLVCTHWITPTDRVAVVVRPELAPDQRNRELLNPDDVASEDEWGRCG